MKEEITLVEAYALLKSCDIVTLKEYIPGKVLVGIELHSLVGEESNVFATLHVTTKVYPHLLDFEFSEGDNNYVEVDGGEMVLKGLHGRCFTLSLFYNEGLVDRLQRLTNSKPEKDWKLRSEELPKPKKRVLAFSPIYPKGDMMRFRILDGQFLRLCGEVTLWADCEELLGAIVEGGELS